MAKKQKATYVVRCGGANSGHTVYDEEGRKWAFRHLPTAAILPCINLVLSSGSYIDIDVLLNEIESAGIEDNRLFIDPYAVIISKQNKLKESKLELEKMIGSTGSGTGAAVAQRVLRDNSTVFAKDIEVLQKYISDTKELLRNALSRNERVIIEGTQGFGLSLLHSQLYPYVTSRDTTAAGFLSEVGLSPFDVDEIALVIRSFPIRVAGDSGCLPREIAWSDITNESKSKTPIIEYTTVTNKVRRVARFDKDIVLKAILVNQPTSIFLNHLDYIGSHEKILKFVKDVELQIERRIDCIGTSPETIITL